MNYRELNYELISILKYDSSGLVPAIVIDSQYQGSAARLGGLLMLGYADEEALALTLNERRAVFWSRSRQEIWRKGDTSGSTMLLRGAYLDCDLDTVVYDVEAPESACHTGSFSCFGLPTIGE